MCLIDDGNSIESGGVRIHPSYRGLKISYQIQDYAEKEIAAAEPKASRNILLTAYRHEFTEKHLRLEPEKYKLLTHGVCYIRSNVRATKQTQHNEGMNLFGNIQNASILH